jgi:hypothetical protein
MRFVAILGLAFVLCGSPACAADFGPANRGYATSISTPKAEYKLGEDVTLTLTVRNVGTSLIRVWDECMTHWTRIAVIDMDGVPLPVHLQNFLCTGNGSVPEPSLAPGAEESHEFSLLKDVGLTLPHAGRFTIQMVYNGLNGLNSDFDPVIFVRSNVIVVTVMP